MTEEVRPFAFEAIQKIDEDERLVFGWAYVARTADGEQVEDHSGDEVTDTRGFEKAVYDYVLFSREGDEMHEGPAVAQLVESVLFTPDKCQQMGIKNAPTGWWIGMKVFDEGVWGKVKAGELKMFSIAGSGVREPV